MQVTVYWTNKNNIVRGPFSAESIRDQHVAPENVFPHEIDVQLRDVPSYHLHIDATVSIPVVHFDGVSVNPSHETIHLSTQMHSLLRASMKPIGRIICAPDAENNTIRCAAFLTINNSCSVYGGWEDGAYVSYGKYPLQIEDISEEKIFEITFPMSRPPMAHEIKKMPPTPEEKRAEEEREKQERIRALGEKEARRAALFAQWDTIGQYAKIGSFVFPITAKKNWHFREHYFMLQSGRAVQFYKMHVWHGDDIQFDTFFERKTIVLFRLIDDDPRAPWLMADDFIKSSGCTLLPFFDDPRGQWW